MRNVSEAERRAMAMYHRREEQWQEALKKNEELKEQLKTMSDYIGELKNSNKLLSAQVRYLVSKQVNHA